MGYPFSSPNRYEEKLNGQFAGYLYYSLQYGPALLNRIHAKTTLSFLGIPSGPVYVVIPIAFLSLFVQYQSREAEDNNFSAVPEPWQI